MTAAAMSSARQSGRSPIPLLLSRSSAQFLIARPPACTLVQGRLVRELLTIFTTSTITIANSNYINASITGVTVNLTLDHQRDGDLTHHPDCSQRQHRDSLLAPW